MLRLIDTISFSSEQVKSFGEITGDNGPVHRVDNVVQGGLIISSLPKFLSDIMTRDNLHTGYTHSKSIILEAKFRNKLFANYPVNVEFLYNNNKSLVSKLNWRIYDSNMEYCHGYWVIHKSKNS